MARDNNDKRQSHDRERDDYVEALRRRYLAGTLDEVLIPDDAPLDRLIDDLFPHLRGPALAT